MMVCWVFAGITVGAAASATFMSDVRRAVLALWVAGLGVGAVYLTLGAELLAVVQWIVSTLVAISFVFFSVMFGDTKHLTLPEAPSLNPKAVMKTLSAGVVGAAFAAIVWLGSGNDVTVVPQPAEGTDLAAIGKALIHDHLLSLEVLALLLFLTLVGAGVIARPDVPDETENTP